jgi:hypothetical protein
MRQPYESLTALPLVIETTVTSSYSVFLASVKAVRSSDPSRQDAKVQTAPVQASCFRYGMCFFFSGAACDLNSLSERSGQLARTSVLPRAIVVSEQRVVAFYNFKNENVAFRCSVVRIGNFVTCQ